MRCSTIFIGLTREVTFVGLPILYLTVLVMTSMVVLITSKSLLYFLMVAGGGYVALRVLAGYDPKLPTVVFVTLKSTPLTRSILMGEEVVYRA